ncbi:MAG: tetratricopeptide repeat protein [Caldilineaceae bacterium]
MQWRRILLFISPVIFLYASIEFHPAVARSFEINLWSIQYLWNATQYPLALLTPDNAWTATIPAGHDNARLWQARKFIQANQFLQAQEILEPILTRNNYEALRLEAQLLEAQGDMADAVELWTEIQAVDDLLEAAEQNIEKGKLDAALLAYKTAYELAPERSVLPLAHFLRLFYQNSAQAESILYQYITSFPSSRYALSWSKELGSIYQDQGAWDKAASVYLGLTKIIPDDPQIWIQLGWASYESSHNIEAALPQFNQAIMVAPYQGEGYFAIASLLTREARFKEADKWYAQALTYDSKRPAWYLARMNAAQQANTLTLAVALARETEALFPNYAQGHYQAAWIYRLNEDRPSAINAIENAIATEEFRQIPQQSIKANYYNRAGQIYEWSGDLDQARAAYLKAIQLHPERDDIHERLRKLADN